MSALPLTKPENISNLLHMDEEYAAPAIVADNVLQKDWNAEHERSFKDPEGFWARLSAPVRVDPAVDQGSRLGRRASQVVHSGPRPTSPSMRSTAMPTPSAAIAPPSSGWAKTARSASSPTASSTARSAASPTA